MSDLEREDAARTARGKEREQATKAPNRKLIVGGVAILAVVGVIAAMAGGGAGVECQKTSASFTNNFNDQLKSGALPFHTMWAIKGEPTSSPLLSDRPYWYVVGDQLADNSYPTWATGEDPFGGDAAGATVPLGPAAEQVSTLGVDVPQGVVEPLAQAAPTDNLQGCPSSSP